MQQVPISILTYPYDLCHKFQNMYWIIVYNQEKRNM